ncbi:hypothetical protein C6N75_17515 [Streptomyces solincola]|uniref:Uncharacterized protein n=1 Tax=Streptomyces solincola TaxID=2100817 RepID=A0A2S9PU79_9ACTN|nr:hypothetical protein C6N75_17515 [Streptomyces solincola]
MWLSPSGSAAFFGGAGVWLSPSGVAVFLGGAGVWLSPSGPATGWSAALLMVCSFVVPVGAGRL